MTKSKQEKKETVRQHYLPRVYLKGFEKDGGLGIFDRETGLTRRQSAENTGLQKHIYTLTDEAGNKRYDIEDMFSKIESDFAYAKQRIESSSSLSAEDRSTLITFIAFAELRTPGAFNEASQVRASFADTILKAITSTPEAAASILRSYYRSNNKEQNEEEIREEAQRMFDFAQSGNYQIDVHKEAALKLSLSLWKPLYEELEKKNLRIVRPKDEGLKYITSDTPVILTSTSEYNVGFGSDEAIILFPLSANCLILFSGNQRLFGTAEAHKQHVEKTNEQIARSAYRYVFGPDEAYLKELAERHKLVKTRRTALYKTGRIKDKNGYFGYIERNYPHRDAPLKIAELESEENSRK